MAVAPDRLPSRHVDPASLPPAAPLVSPPPPGTAAPRSVSVSGRSASTSSIRAAVDELHVAQARLSADKVKAAERQAALTVQRALAEKRERGRLAAEHDESTEVAKAFRKADEEEKRERAAVIRMETAASVAAARQSVDTVNRTVAATVAAVQTELQTLALERQAQEQQAKAAAVAAARAALVDKAGADRVTSESPARTARMHREASIASHHCSLAREISAAIQESLARRRVDDIAHAAMIRKRVAELKRRDAERSARRSRDAVARSTEGRRLRELATTKLAQVRSQSAEAGRSKVLVEHAEEQRRLQQVRSVLAEHAHAAHETVSSEKQLLAELAKRLEADDRASKRRAYASVKAQESDAKASVAVHKSAVRQVSIKIAEESKSLDEIRRNQEHDLLERRKAAAAALRQQQESAAEDVRKSREKSPARRSEEEEHARRLAEMQADHQRAREALQERLRRERSEALAKRQNDQRRRQEELARVRQEAEDRRVKALELLEQRRRELLGESVAL